MNSCVLPVITYGSQTWAITQKYENKIKIRQNKMERIILGIKTNDWIRIRTIKKRKRVAITFYMPQKD
jgi:hypothetical protein